LVTVRAHSRLRWASAAIAVGLLVVCLGLQLPSVAHAQSAAELESELASLKAQTKHAGDAWDHAAWTLDEADWQLAATNKKLAKTRKELAAAKLQLGSRVSQIYRRSTVGPIEFLLGASSFEDFVRRMDYMRRVSAADAKSVSDVKVLQTRLVADRAALIKNQKVAAGALTSLKVQRDRLNAQLTAKQSEFKRVKAELDAVRGGPNRPSGQAATAGGNGMVFPVVGSYYYSDTFGAARAGHTHQGTDIMSPGGTPVVAIASGSVSSKEGGLGGKTIWLTCNNGFEAYYAHLSGWAVRSGSVKAGQIIGYVGNTGNAAGGATHLHIQLYPGGKLANPYPYLRAME
jgi:murein DD-endopeptidase MepM/ murein hydrolase activator NlpD